MRSAFWGLLDLGITQKERRFRYKDGFFAQILCFFIFKVEILRISSFLCSFCTAVSSLAVFLYGYRSSADDFCSKSSKPQKALRIKNLDLFVKIA